MDKMNSFFGYSVVEKLKFTSFDNEKKVISSKNDQELNVTNTIENYLTLYPTS